MPETLTRWQKLRGFSLGQWAIVAQTPLVLLATWLRLRRGGYRATLAALPEAVPANTPAEEQLIAARETALAVAAGLRAGPWKPRCLLRSLVLANFLSRQGMPFDLRLGVATKAGEDVDFNAHAWVEHAGVVLNDREDVASQFRAFDTGSGPA